MEIKKYKNMNNILKSLLITIVTIVLVSSCKKYDDSARELDLFSGTFKGTMKTMIFVKPDSIFHEQKNVEITLTPYGGNYANLTLGGEYKHTAGVEIPETIRMTALENYDGIQYHAKITLIKNTIPYKQTGVTVKKVDGKLTMFIRISDTTPFTTIEFKED